MIPEKLSELEENDYNFGYAQGWNACVDAVSAPQQAGDGLTVLQTWNAVCEEAQLVVRDNKKFLMLSEDMCVRLGGSIEDSAVSADMTDEQIITQGYMHTVEMDEPLFTFDRPSLLSFARSLSASRQPGEMVAGVKQSMGIAEQAKRDPNTGLAGLLASAQQDERLGICGICGYSNEEPCPECPPPKTRGRQPDYKARFDTMVCMIGEISQALGISDDDAACANGNDLILAAIAELRQPAQQDEREAMRIFEEHLNDLRDMDVSAAFHKIVAMARALTAKTAAQQVQAAAGAVAITLDDVLAWADGVNGGAGTEHSAKITGRELAIAQSIVDGESYANAREVTAAWNRRALESASQPSSGETERNAGAPDETR